MSKNFNITVNDYVLKFEVTCDNEELVEVNVEIPAKRKNDRGTMWEHSFLRATILENLNNNKLIKNDENNFVTYANAFASTNVVFCFKKPQTVTILNNNAKVAKSTNKAKRKSTIKK